MERTAPAQIQRLHNTMWPAAGHDSAPVPVPAERGRHTHLRLVRGVQIGSGEQQCRLFGQNLLQRNEIGGQPP